MTTPLPSRPRRPKAHALALALLLLLPALFPPDAHAGPLVEFDPEPYHLPSMGLSLSMPLHADVRASWAGAVATIRISDARNRWVVNVQDGTLPEGRSLDALADQVEATHAAPASPARLLSRRDDLRVGGHPAVQLYFQLRSARNESPVVQAHTFVHAAERRVLTFSLTTSRPVLDTARIAYEGMLSSARIEDPSRELDRRRSALDATATLLSAPPSAHLDALLGGDRWYRLLEPAPTALDADATEHGYRHVALARGRSSDVPGATPPSPRTGYTLSVRSRLLIDDRVIDSTALYFLSDDRSFESWRVEMAIRDPDARDRTRSWIELARREGDRLTITTRSPDAETRSTEVTVPPEGYLSQVEALLWPDILARARRPGTYASYAYRTQKSRITLRMDTFGPAPGRPGLSRLESRDDAGETVSTSLFREDASLLSTTLPNSRVWRPSSPQALSDAWKSKDLPFR